MSDELVSKEEVLDEIKRVFSKYSDPSGHYAQVVYDDLHSSIDQLPAVEDSRKISCDADECRFNENPYCAKDYLEIRCIWGNIVCKSFEREQKGEADEED